MSAARALARADQEAAMAPREESHVPVLAPELLEVVAPRPGQTVVDCTFGAGGHARMVAEAIGPQGTLVCMDRDPVAERRFTEFAAEARCRTRFLATEFSAGLALLLEEGLSVSAVYMDLGMSSLQVDAAGRGFSYSHDAPLDMRMDTRQELTAERLLNEWPQAKIADVLRRYGEERYSAGIAREIVRRRPLATTTDLVEAVKAGMPTAARFAGGHPARRTFQAVRIAVNGELEAIDSALPAAWELLEVGGRMAAISFHSLEDRRIKRFFAEKATGCVCPPELPVCICGREPEGEPIARRGIAPSEAEVEANPRARSARLRGCRKIRTPEQARPMEEGA